MSFAKYRVSDRHAFERSKSPSPSDLIPVLSNSRISGPPAAFTGQAHLQRSRLATQSALVGHRQIQLAPRAQKYPEYKPQLYGRFFGDLANCQKLRDDIRDRAAYLHSVGYVPSHLRTKATQILFQNSDYFRRPTCLDGRLGDRRLKEDAIRDLNTNDQDMVKEVRERVSQGFRIQQSLRFGTRRNFGKIYMFKRNPDQTIGEKITVMLSEAVKRGWD